MIEEFGSENLDLLNQKGAYPYKYMDSLKSEKNLPAKKCFYRTLKNGTTDDNGKKLDGHMSHEEYLTCEKIWDVFDTKNMGDYHDHYLRCFVIS